MSTNALTLTTEPGTPFIDGAREFDASVSQVFRAYIDPDLVRQWLGPRTYAMRIDAFDARQGGWYRYVHSDDDGNEYGFRGCFHSVERDKQIIQTFEFEGAPGQVAIETATFEDLGGGRCRVNTHSVYPSVESRDAMVSSGMEEGARDSFDQLDELLASQDS